MGEIEERYKKLHLKSANLYETSKQLFPDGVTHDARRVEPFPLYIDHASGPRKWDIDGHEYIDYFGGHGAHILGHSHPEIVKAVNEQMAKGTQYGFNHELEVKWALWIKKLMPAVEKVRFHSSGTEATLMALRMARAYTGKSKVIKFKDHFHGWHDYVVAVGGDRGVAGIPKETLSTMIVLPADDISLVEKTLQENKDVAAVIVEATGAHMGNHPINPSFLHELREVTKKYGVVFIMDEVVTGFRVSPGGVQVRYNVQPDLTTLAKILGGGLPGGAVAGKAEFIEMIQFRNDPAWDSTRRIAHAGTFNANPLSAAGGCKALELVATTPVNAKADAAAQRFKDGMNKLLAQMEIPGCCTGLSSMLQFRLGWQHECDKEMCHVTDQQLANAQKPAVMKALRLALLNEGVHGGLTTNLFSCTHTDKDIDQTVAAYEKALTAVRKQGLL